MTTSTCNPAYAGEVSDAESNIEKNSPLAPNNSVKDGIDPEDNEQDVKNNSDVQGQIADTTTVLPGRFDRMAKHFVAPKRSLRAVTKEATSIAQCKKKRAGDNTLTSSSQDKTKSPRHLDSEGFKLAYNTIRSINMPPRVTVVFPRVRHY